MSRALLTEAEVKLLQPGSPCYVLKGTLVTALARELAVRQNNPIIECETLGEVARLKPYNRVVALGADHHGWKLKEPLKAFLVENGYSVLDCGTDNDDSVDYADFALRVANAIRCGHASRGIVIEAVGTGSCMLANKVPGIRAAQCYDRLTARHSREQYDANVLTLGGQVLSWDQASMIVTTWLSTSFGGGQHRSRIVKIDEVEGRFLKDTVLADAGDCTCAL